MALFGRLLYCSERTRPRSKVEFLAPRTFLVRNAYIHSYIHKWFLGDGPCGVASFGVFRPSVRQGLDLYLGEPVLVTIRLVQVDF